MWQEEGFCKGGRTTRPDFIDDYRKYPRICSIASEHPEDCGSDYQRCQSLYASIEERQH
jgi:hypothetical protein